MKVFILTHKIIHKRCEANAYNEPYCTKIFAKKSYAIKHIADECISNEDKDSSIVRAFLKLVELQQFEVAAGLIHSIGYGINILEREIEGHILG